MKKFALFLLVLFSCISAFGMKITGDSILISNPKNKQDSIKQLIQKYYLATSVEEKLAWTAYPDSLKNSVASFLAGHINPEATLPENITLLADNVHPSNFIKVAIKGHSYILLVFKDGNGQYKIDIPSSYGINKISLVAFKSLDDSIPKSFRLEIKMEYSSYFPVGYNINGITYSKDNYFNFIINDDNGGGEVLADKKSEMGKELFDLCQDGYTHRVVIQIKNVQVNNSSGAILQNTMMITKFIQEDWIIK